LTVRTRFDLCTSSTRSPALAADCTSERGNVRQGREQHSFG
jgi:hypothetical protein